MKNICVTFDHKNDTEVMLSSDSVFLIHYHEDPDVGVEYYRHQNGNVNEVAELLAQNNDAYQNGKRLHDNPFNEYTSQATYAWEYALREMEKGNSEEQPYSVYSEFDAEKHKATYPHYLECLIDAKGHVMYAVPSHQELAIQLACEKHGITREELGKMCPKEYYCDFLTWLLKQTGAISVWLKEYVGEPNEKQKETLRTLKEKGIYEGEI